MVDLWGNCVEEDLILIGGEERRIVIEKGHYDDGVPCITVIADGGWSKRSHRHSYNALGANLEKLVDENPHYKGKGELSKAALKCAIRLRTGENNSKSAATKLDKDIHNSVHHVFDDHPKLHRFL
ncbi:hypothetical protein KUTeg_020776 [Tegillarca granosa]|uniref:Uncharacterized protein n=1 Tax=Tegillarca granosa TaxID=220873 RepID=A0ABQ9E8X3_TEGGR|nr:hypothetical protein KUTeg_020776 [Tegillarca granosa]